MNSISMPSMHLSLGWVLLAAVILVVILPDSKVKGAGTLLLAPIVLVYLGRMMYTTARPAFDLTMTCLAMGAVTMTIFLWLRKQAVNDAKWLPASMTLSESQKAAIAENREDAESWPFRIRWYLSTVLGVGIVLLVILTLGA